MTCGAPSENDSWLKAGRWSVRLSEEYEVRDRSYKGSHRVVNDFDESLFISRAAVQARVGLTDDWTGELTATYPHFTYRVRPPGSERIKERFRGPGDTFVLFGRRVDIGPAHDPASHDMTPPPLFSLWAGAALPTGSPERPNPAIVTRDVSVSNLQTGTGTFDPMARARLEWPRESWIFFAETDVRFPLYENRFRYRTGDVEALSVGAALPVVSKLTASFAITGQRTARDQFRGSDVGVGGERIVYAEPGLAWSLSDSATLDFSVRLPVGLHADTKLSESNSVLRLGLTLRF